MRPAVCKVCNTSAIQSPKGEWINFLDYKSLDDGEIGHPDGLEWFCEIHVEAAKLLSNKKSSDAVEELRNKYSASTNIIGRNDKRKWWRRFINF